MQITWNQQVVKRNNKSLVLQIIKEQSPLSRADIAGRLGLNKSTVSSLVSELIEEELINETGPGESSGGRRPVMLLFNNEAGFSIGIDIGVNYLLGVLTDLSGKIIEEKNIPLTKLSYHEVINQVTKIAKEFIDSAPKSRYGVVGIGIAVPGIVDKIGNVLLAPNLDWNNKDLKVTIEERIKLPVMIENEANAGAYGEMRFGSGQDYANMVYISAGIGIGVGLILKGELYRGINGFSGESGHMTIDFNGRKCSCGRKGCWEAYASEHALLTQASKRFQGEVTLEELISLASDDNEVNTIFKDVGMYLGYGISNLINSLNPEQVIIGNRISMAKDLVTEALNDAIKQQTLVYHQEQLQINFSKLSVYSSALGVAAFVIENFFKEEQLVEQQ